MTHSEREEMKRVGYQYGIQDFVIYSHWMRSREAANDNRHPDYGEYKEAYLSGDKAWLPANKSYVNMEVYLAHYY